jgi:glycosyltransferase involved in cell wall biosynthesis
MPTAPLVTIVIAVHDTPAEFMREAVASVRNQSEPRWELVLVLDAASTDCATVARAAATEDPERIRVVGEEGGMAGGLSAARNKGIASARGSFVGFLDADDVLEHDALRVRIEIMDAHPGAAMVYGPTQYWFSWTGRGRDQGRDWRPELGVATGQHEPPTLVARFIDGRASVPCPCSILVRRWAIDAVGGFNTEFRDLYEDQVFYSRIALRHRIIVHDRVLDRYRRHAQSMTARRSHDDVARERFLAWLEQEVAATDTPVREITGAIARERWRMRHPLLAGIARRMRKLRRRVRNLVTGRRTSPEPGSYGFT